MADRYITSANAVLVLSCPALGIAGVQLREFETDKLYESGDVDQLEAQVTADGYLAMGFVPNAIPMNISFKANSPSIDVFASIRQYQAAFKSVAPISLVITLPAISKTYSFAKGGVKTGPTLPSGGKVLGAVTYGCVFEAAA